MSNKQTAAMLDKKLDAKTVHTMLVCGIVMVIAVLLHDGDHIRQALNWGYHIPLAIWALNLTVYVFPVVTIFLAKSSRMSATLVGAIGGIFTSALLCHPASLRFCHRSLGRLELLLFRADQGRHLSGQLLSGRGLAELGAVVPRAGLMSALLLCGLQAVFQAEKGSKRSIRFALCDKTSV